MIVDRLRLEHFRCFQRAEVHFAPGFNLITGDNGLGKSFLLDIAWWTSTGIEARYPARPQQDQDDASVVVTTESGERRLATDARFQWIAQEQGWSLVGANQRFAAARSGVW